MVFFKYMPIPANKIFFCWAVCCLFSPLKSALVFLPSVRQLSASHALHNIEYLRLFETRLSSYCDILYLLLIQIIIDIIQFMLITFFSLTGNCFLKINS